MTPQERAQDLYAQIADESMSRDVVMRYINAFAAETRRAALLEAAEKVPTTWLDPLLWNIKLSPCPEIEALLRGVKDKITRLAQKG